MCHLSLIDFPINIQSPCKGFSKLRIVDLIQEGGKGLVEGNGDDTKGVNTSTVMVQL